MERALCASLVARAAARGTQGAAAEGEDRVCVYGWVAQVRRLGGLTFLVVRDRSGTAQVVLDREDLAAGPIPPREAIVRVSGWLRPEPRAPGGVELRAQHLEVLVEPAQPPSLPLYRDHLDASLEVVLAQRALSLRHPRERAAFAVQAALVRGLRRYLDACGFTEVHTPKLTGTATEGGSEVFAVDYFGRRAYLAQSPQLYKQLLVGAGFERVYEVGAAYRAEPHDTARHLNEYISLDVESELFGGGGTGPLLELERGLLRAMFTQVETDAGDALDRFGVRALPDPAAAVAVTLAEALEGIGRTHLDPEAERLLGEWLGPLVFVTDWPVAQRPFYAMERADAPGLTHSFDLLLHGLEVTTGGQREHRPGPLRAMMAQRGLNVGAFAAYLAAFDTGMPPHGGFAIGLERLTAQLLGIRNVRRASLFPRDRSRLEP